MATASPRNWGDPQNPSSSSAASIPVYPNHYLLHRPTKKPDEPFFKKPCVTLRDETEWVELVENGFNLVAGADSDRIYQCFRETLEKKMDFSLRLYGEGCSGDRIVSIMMEYLC
jgi:hypothetical protein